MHATAPSIPLDLDGFLAWEERQAERFELAGGTVRRMAGDTEDHDRVGGNIGAALRVRLRGTLCSAHGSNLKLVSSTTGAVMYPDAFVRCGARDGRRTLVEDAVVAFEVLSESTAQHDLTRKRLAYEAMPSLRRLVFVSLLEPRLDVRVRGADGLWYHETVEGLAAVLRLPELELGLPLAEIYEETALAAPERAGP